MYISYTGSFINNYDLFVWKAAFLLIKIKQRESLHKAHRQKNGKCLWTGIRNLYMYDNISQTFQNIFCPDFHLDLYGVRWGVHYFSMNLCQVTNMHWFEEMCLLHPDQCCKAWFIPRQFLCTHENQYMYFLICELWFKNWKRNWQFTNFKQLNISLKSQHINTGSDVNLLNVSLQNCWLHENTLALLRFVLYAAWPTRVLILPCMALSWPCEWAAAKSLPHYRIAILGFLIFFVYKLKRLKIIPCRLCYRLSTFTENKTDGISYVHFVTTQATSTSQLLHTRYIYFTCNSVHSPCVLVHCSTWLPW